MPAMPPDNDPAAAGTTRVILLAHGSKQPQWARPFESVLALVQALPRGFGAELAYLESMHPLLDEALDRAGLDGCTSVRVVPLFLGAGGHLGRDIPRRVAQARARHPGMGVHVARAAGESEEVIAALAAYARRCLDETGD